MDSNEILQRPHRLSRTAREFAASNLLSDSLDEFLDVRSVVQLVCDLETIADSDVGLVGPVASPDKLSGML